MRKGPVFEQLARWRVTLGFVAGLVVLWLADPTPHSIVIGAAIAACGEGLRIWAAGHLNKSREVTSSGPYAWFAHPLYVGSSVMGAGLAIAAGSVAVAILIGAYLVVTLTAAIRTEEAFLRKAFGDGYDSYRRGGGRRDDRTTGPRRFALAQAMANREYRAAIGFVVAILLLLLKGAYKR